MNDLFDLPELPYAGTSGWSGSSTSRNRAIEADKSGKTRDRQQQVLTLLANAGGHGMTWQELSTETGWHHGTASGALSVLHKTDRIARLTEKRNKCKVYVLPDEVNERATEPHRGSIQGRASNQQEALMMTERQADVLIAGRNVLVKQIERNLGAWADSRETAEAVIETVADWLSTYRPADFGDDYCTPLDVTAFILRKGETRE